MKEKTTVLHLLWSGLFGGAEKVAQDIALYSDSDAFRHILCFLSHGGELEQRWADMGLEVCSLNMKSGLSLHKSLILFDIIRKYQPRIMLFHKPNFASALISIFFKNVDKVHFEHGADLISENPLRDILFYKLFGSRLKLILANSHFTKTIITKKAGVNPDKIAVVPIGINCSTYGKRASRGTLRNSMGLDESHRIIGFVGRLVEQKGVDDFIRVAELINQRLSRCVFMIVGDGIKRNALKEIASQCEARILFLGERSDIPEIMNDFDIFLMTSRWEPYGIVVLEALASGIPVIGFRIPGMSEILDCSGGGILIEKRCQKEMADTTISLLEDPERIRRLSEEGYANTRKIFDVRKTIQEIQKRLKSLEAVDNSLDC